ncbi:MAG: hypothetical protein KKH94_05555 [Candidatus Omnitrophica bacterium]|nr:hypothetical protein [Candidatus Omnitrophota bacterium]
MALDLEPLKQLQIIDKEIFDLQEEQKNIPLQISALKEGVTGEKAAVSDAEEGLKKIKLDLNKQELALKEKEESIAKYEAQLMQVKTNKEYSALQKEIADIKADNSILEEEIIKKLDEVQTHEAAVNAVRAKLKQAEDESARTTKQLEEKIEQSKIRIKELESQKEVLAKGVVPNIYATYERIVKAKNGVALSKVEDEACGVCHMRLLSQRINEILLGAELIVCDSCSRILYMLPESSK